MALFAPPLDSKISGVKNAPDSVKPASDAHHSLATFTFTICVAQEMHGS